MSHDCRHHRRVASTAPAKPRQQRDAHPKGHTGTWYLLATVVGLLVVIGLVMVLSASSVESQRHSHSVWSEFTKQALWAFLGVVAMTAVASVDYRRWRRAASPLLVISFVLLVIVLIPGVGLSINGARSWLAIGPLRLQPAEVAKLALLLSVADLLARRMHRVGEPRLTLRPAMVFTASACVLLMLQPALGSTVVLATMILGVVWVAGVPGRHLATTAGVTVGLASIAAVAAPYRRDRVMAFLHPAADRSNTGYQLNQSLMGIATGHLFGSGLGQSRAKWGFLPNASTDLIFAVIAEELGLLGAAVIIALFLLFGLLGVRIALRAPDAFGMLMAAGITTWILVQAFVNIASVAGVLPLAGLTLPFISYGGTSLVVTMVASGVLLNIASHSSS